MLADGRVLCADGEAVCHYLPFVRFRVDALAVVEKRPLKRTGGKVAS